MSGTVVLAPKRLCFPELLEDDYLYTNMDDLRYKLTHFLKNPNEVPKLKNMEQVKNFYKNICTDMKKYSI